MSITFKTKPFSHQLEEFEQNKDNPAWGLLWEPGCVDAETEYLAPDGWHGIDSYSTGPVAQVDVHDRHASFVEPLRYVVEDCQEFLHFKHGRGLDQMLSPDHRVPWLSKPNNNLRENTAAEIEDDLQGTTKGQRKLLNRFRMDPGGTGIGLSDAELRVQIAAMADGHFQSKTNRCVIRLKKTRKIERLQELLVSAGIKHQWHNQQSTGFVIFTFDAPMRLKQYPWWSMLPWECRTVVDEVWRWDGSAAKDGRGWQFFSNHESDVDFIQYAASCQGLVATKCYDPRGHWRLVIRGTCTDIAVRSHHISRVPSKDGKSYCFQVPSGYLLLRRNGIIFITGNCGKTWPVLNEAAYLEDCGEIRGLMVLSPNGVHRNWTVDQVPTHLPEELFERTNTFLWQTSKANTKWHQNLAEQALKHDDFGIVSMSYDSVMTTRGKAFWKAFMDSRRCMYALDESPRIKTPGAKRSMRISGSSKAAPFRRILTGTIVADKPFDVYNQIRFLDPAAWNEVGCSDFNAFKNTFGVWRRQKTMRFDKRTGQMKEFEFPSLVSFRNMPLLQSIVAKYGSRLLKEDVLDLPPKLYSKRYFDMTPAQWRAYKELQTEYYTVLPAGEMVAAELVITRNLRLQQVTSGYLPSDDDGGDLIPICDPNPRMKLLVECVEDAGHQCIVWAKYRQDITKILESLKAANISAVRYDGQCNETEMGEAVDNFKAGNAQVFVGNPAKGSEGITLTCAKTMIYYNCSYRLDQRIQSEDRFHRIGQDVPVHIIDLVATDTIDSAITDSLVQKFEMASFIQGDKIREWI